MSQQDMLALLGKIKTDFYTDEPKNTFFKNGQKAKVSEKITNQINIQDLLRCTVYILPNTNRVYLDYPLLKQYANSNNYEDIVNYVICVLLQCIQIYGEYEMHIDLKGFTISAAERYKLGIQLFCNKCSTDTQFANLLIHMYIYHTPSVIENITRLFAHFIDPVIPNKLVYLSKIDSPRLLEELLQPSTTLLLQQQEQPPQQSYNCAASL